MGRIVDKTAVLHCQKLQLFTQNVVQLFIEALYCTCCIIVMLTIVEINAIEEQNGTVQNKTNKHVLK